MVIRIGIIGCGSITQKRHAPEYAENENVEIVAFYDRNLDRAEKLAKTYNAKAVNDYMDIMRDPNIDAISDCSTNEMHHIISGEALKNGKHVLCEKPMAISVEAAETLVGIWESSGKVLMVDHNQRLAPAHIKAKEILDSGEMGKILTFRTSFGHKGPEYWSSAKNKSTWFFDKERSRLGVVGDLGIHKIDLLRYLMNDEIVEMKAFSDVLDKTDENGKKIEVPDNLVASIKMKQGYIGNLAFSWTYYGKEDNSTNIYCEKGIIKIYDDSNYPLVLEYSDGTNVNFEVGEIQTNDNQTNTGVINEFISSIMEGRQPIANGYDGLESLRLTEKLLMEG